ncbi:MAG: ComEC/Rec2 family competence protein [Candidatus Paceibacterota bacterium]|jgi:competence protein ComEC
MRIEPLPFLLIGFVAGVAIGSFFDFGFSFTVFFAALGGALFLLHKFLSKPRSVFAISFFLIALALGLARTGVEQYRYENNLSPVVGEKITVRGIISEYPDMRETNARYIVEPEEISIPGNELPATGRILVISDLYPALHYGDEVLLSGKLQTVKNFSDGGINFDYKKYLSKDGIFNEMFYPNISVVSQNKGNFLISKLFSTREKFSGKLRENINEPGAALALGMLIGEKHALPQNILDTFKRAGVIHLVVLSGYNIALVSQFFMKIFSFLPILYRAGAGGVAIAFFVLMTGGGASAIRAAVMALIALLGVATGRTYDAGRALFIAGFLMLLENPNVLVFDPSFQLSFLATLGLIYLTPLIHARLGKWKPRWLRELLSQTLATQMAVLPLLIYMSGSVSLLSIPANLLILPTVPFAMMGSFVTGILGFMGHAIALPFSIVTSTLLSYAILTAKFFAGLPFSALAIPAGVGSIIAVVLVMVVVIILKKNKSRAPEPARALS